MFEELLLIEADLKHQIDLVNSLSNISVLEKTAETKGLNYALSLVSNLIKSNTERSIYEQYKPTTDCKEDTLQIILNGISKLR